MSKNQEWYRKNSLALCWKEVPKFQEVGQDLLKTKREAIRASTLEIYRGQPSKDFPDLDQLRVDRITAKTIEQWIENRRAAGVELVTLKKVMLMLGAVLRYSVRHRYATHNPISDAERPGERDGARQKSPPFGSCSVIRSKN